MSMLEIERKILDIDRTICENMELLEYPTVTRALISQNILSQSRNLVEHIAVRIYSNGKDISIDWDTIPAALDYIKQNNKYLFLRKFHGFLQESKSHYTPEHEGAERLMLKYYPYFVILKNFMMEEFGLNILHNLDKYPINPNRSIEEYQLKIAEKLNMTYMQMDYSHSERLYIHKVLPFVVNKKVYYELVLTPAFNTTSKFDRFIAYSKIMIPSHYSIKAAIFNDYISINNMKMPISIITEYSVSIRPCELNNYAKLFGEKIRIDSKSAEYIGMMKYLTKSGANLLDIVTTTKERYNKIKQFMFFKSQVHHFEEILDLSRQLIIEGRPGSNILRYLLSTLNNKVLKQQYCTDKNRLLSDLCLKYGCIPFDQMPFATSLIQHNPDFSELFSCIDCRGKEHELLARYIHSNMCANSKLYTSIKEFEPYFDNVEDLIRIFNNNVYYKHSGRKIEKYGDNVYINSALTHTYTIISKLQASSQEGLQGYSNAMNTWIEEKQNVDCAEKREILKNLYSQTKVSLLYGAAGTGKTYLINLVSQFFDTNSKLFLANTNPAVENLKRNVKAQNCDFSTIRKYVLTKNVKIDYDVLIVDECSMISNEDMAAILNKIQCEIILLVGDTYQIESIMFGNWFSMAKYFVPSHAWHELETPYRTKDEALLNLWSKVRNLDDDLTEYMVSHRYSSNLNKTIFEKQADDEIILCLNYDGLYGINNINRFFQENNSNPAYLWGLWTYKVGDPILFNESERFVPLLYNNLKGTIIDIEEDQDCEKIWFTIQIDKALTKLDVKSYDIELLDEKTPGKSVIKFYVRKKNELDDDNDIADDTDIPFQIAYAVSIHKSQGLEYDSVKVIITEEVDEMISHNIFYTAITRSKQHLMIYWSPETQEKVISSFEKRDSKNDATIFSAQTGLKKKKIK